MHSFGKGSIILNVQFQWHTPEDLLNMHNDKTVWLPPPQFYEMQRLKNYKSIDAIAEFSKNRDGQDVPLILPINYMLSDGMTLVYPGDDLYPSDANPYETTHDYLKYKDKSYKELAALTKNHCRIEMVDMFARNFLCNVTDELLSASSSEAVKGNL
jgi:hypothetical protein